MQLIPYFSKQYKLGNCADLSVLIKGVQLAKTQTKTALVVMLNVILSCQNLKSEITDTIANFLKVI